MPVGKEDGDIDNDGDTDSSDSYLKKRRAAIKKRIMGDKSDNKELPEALKKNMKKKEDESQEDTSDNSEDSVDHKSVHVALPKSIWRSTPRKSTVR